ncbi:MULTISPECIES: type II toxin-antitoxin system PemK/MazF family toxin [Thiothrix]|uniref:mRNA interferase n=2 Tax=Thiothrix TaxID=1030 RepID=A0A1H4FLZ4_9GAMM|nr:MULTISPECIES: type II toxin-antitoxin system PemK/MazF family toxin [Thiothrix]WML91023.1 type II toxin-antitoxin system PemK/MazF family toxin [Thiothrix lacustris]WMP17080.1 type II toxin-antitoxin system PemK/MazF family toxin [Thiothrix lacustris]SEA98314.1 mRNA interferase MazF [Thiothrix caldifontis]
MKRGEIWWASLEEPRGSEPGYKRPVVIISSDDFNQSRIQTVVVAIVTSNLRLANAPGNISISKRDSGLSKESVINVSQILTLDKVFLTEKVSRLPDKKILALDESLKLSLSLF